MAPSDAEITVRRVRSEDSPAIESLAGRLRRWFSPSDLARISHLMQTHLSGWVAVDQGEQVVGFLLDAPTDDPGVRELAWMGVDTAWQGRGVGTHLLEAMLSALRQEGRVKEIEVSTVAASMGYAPYEATRAFYHTRGFVDRRVESDYYWPGGDRLILRRAVL